MSTSIKQYRGASGLVLLLSTTTAFGFVAGCGEAFSSCMETHTCRPTNDGAEAGMSGEGSGTAGTASAGGEASGGNSGRSETSGGEAQGGAPADVGAGGAPGEEGGAPTVTPPDDTGEACSDAGALRCVGPAQKVSQICEDGEWTTAVICKADENCDQRSGACAPILAECQGKIGDQLYCGPEDKVFQCGADLVSTEEVEVCSGNCVDSDASATCAPTTCGDGKVQAPEACDDGNEDQTDACTNACQKAKCGDGSTWKDHEDCDDGNAKNDDACSATCKPATCGDGFIWAGKETCDDKNKVNTDACTNTCQKATCGDGIIQTGKEQCDDKNAVAGDGCSKTCTVDAPPAGAFAWYKATKEDVTVVTATLSDGNDFIKSGWVKSNATVEASQPDVEGGNGATAVYTQNLNTESTMKHLLGTSSYKALKTLRIRAKRGQRQYISLGGPAPTSGAEQPIATFNLLNGVVSHKLAVADAKMTPVKDLWYDCEVTLVSEGAFWISVPSGPVTQEPLVWLQNATVEQSYVTAWSDRIGTRDFKDASGGWRWHSSSPEFNGSPAIEAWNYLGPTLTAGSAADWQFLHDGSGGTIVLLQNQGRPSGSYTRSFGTEFTGAEQGVRLGVSKADSAVWGYGIGNESGETIVSLLGGTTTGTRWLAGSYAATQSPNAQLFESGVMVASANAAATPTTKPSTQPLRLGDASSSPSQRVSEVVVYKRALTTADVEQLKLYFTPQLPR